MKQATFRIVYFPKPDKYIGMAWNYDQAVLVSTIPLDTYSEARNQLEQDCSIVKVELKWYDGSYVYDSQTGFIHNEVAGGSSKSGIAATEENSFRSN